MRNPFTKLQNPNLNFLQTMFLNGPMDKGTDERKAICVFHSWGHNIRIHHEYEDDMEICPEDSCLASQGLPRDDKRISQGTDDYILTRIIESFSCSPLTFYFKICFQKSLNTLRCNII